MFCWSFGQFRFNYKATRKFWHLRIKLFAIVFQKHCSSYVNMETSELNYSLTRSYYSIIWAVQNLYNHFIRDSWAFLGIFAANNHEKCSFQLFIQTLRDYLHAQREWEGIKSGNRTSSITSKHKLKFLRHKSWKSSWSIFLKKSLF